MNQITETRRSARLAAGLLSLALCLGPSAWATQVGQDPSIDQTDDPLVLQRLGVLYLQENRTGPAIRALERSVELYADNGETHMWLGFARFLDGDLEVAEESYRRALEKNPDLTEAYNYLGMLYAKREEWSRAVEAFESALDDPTYPTASRRTVRLNLGRTLLQSGDPAAALPHLRKAADLLPSREDGATVVNHLLLAEALWELGRPDEAESALDKVLELQKDNADAHLLLGEIYVETGRADLARTHLKEVRRLVPGSPVSAEANALLERLES